MTRYHIWKHELDTDLYYEVEVFTSYEDSTDFQAFKNAAGRLWQLQYNKQGEWIDKFTFRTDLFVYTLCKYQPSRVNSILSDEKKYNQERYHSLTESGSYTGKSA